MKRWAFDWFCLLSLLVLVSSVALWVRSHYISDWFQHFGISTPPSQQPLIRRTLRYTLDSVPGAIEFERCEADLRGTEPFASGWFHAHLPPEERLGAQDFLDYSVNLHVGGFEMQYLCLPQPSHYASTLRLAVPFWLFLPAAIPPLLWVRGWRRSRRRGFPITPSLV